MIPGELSPEETVAALRAFNANTLFDEQDVTNTTPFWEELLATSRKLTSYRKLTGRISSLWGVTPIAGLNFGRSADRFLNVRSESITFNSYYITSEFDYNLSKLQDYIIQNHNELFYTFRRYVFAWALLRYDIFHFYNDRGILEPAGGYGSDRFGISILEMKTIRRAGKALFTYAYGADHRMRNKTLATDPLNFCMECPEPGKFCLCDDEGGMEMLETIRDNATRMIGCGLSLDLLPDARALNYLVVDTDALIPDSTAMTAPSEGPLRVGHFPNHGFFKGSRFLIAAIEDLQAEGHAIELVQFSGLPREQILKSMQTVDVVVDQLISGSFGLTAIEAMALGRPVICRLRDGIALASRQECPIIEADPSNIKTILLNIIQDRSLLDGLGDRGRYYAGRYHSIESLACRLSELYSENIDLPLVASAKIKFGAYRSRRAMQAKLMAISLQGKR